MPNKHWQKNVQRSEDLAEPTYLYNQRKDNPGFKNMVGCLIASQRSPMCSLSSSSIAALITFTTTRMVEENRKEIGTLKAMGYGKVEISLKYLIYALLSSAIGIISGAVLGTELLPRLIYFHPANGIF